MGYLYLYVDSILTPVAGKEPTATIPVQYNYGTAEPNKENYLKKDLIKEILIGVAFGRHCNNNKNKTSTNHSEY